MEFAIGRIHAINGNGINMRNREWRRYIAKKKAEDRIKAWKSHSGWIMSERHKGMAKKSNFSCGCVNCKPWKHGLKR